MSPSSRLRAAGILTVNARLWLINALLAGAIVVVIGQAWSTLDRHRASADRLSALRLAHYYHRNAALSHENLQSEVASGLRERELGVKPRGDVVERVGQHARQARAHLSEVEKLLQPDALLAGHLRLQPDVQRYTETATRVAAMAERNPKAARKEAELLNGYLEVLRAGMTAQSQAMEKHLEDAEHEAQTEQAGIKQRLVLLGVFVVLAACTLTLLIARSLRRSLHEVSSVARRIAGGEFGVRAPVPTQDELGELGDAINSMAQNLEGMIERMRSKAQEDAFANQLDDALEMADSESQACEVVAHAMRVIDARTPMDLHLADAERLHLRRAVQHPLAGAAGCAVSTPSQCIAVRRGVAQVFPDSESLNACPHLRGRPAGALAAVCVPVSFMGRSLGVLHAAASRVTPLEPACIERLGTLGMQAGTRIGTLRSIRRTQQQADTDALTGLLNRRALERAVQALQGDQRSFAVVMADIDYFKRLNDTHGHDAGDRALRAFAALLARQAGEGALVARWGGEEFLLVLPETDTSRACDLAESVRQALAGGPPPGGLMFTASFGAADSAMATGFDAVVALADSALYRAKESGRNRVMAAAPGNGDDATATAQTAESLDDTLIRS